MSDTKQNFFWLFSDFRNRIQILNEFKQNMFTISYILNINKNKEVLRLDRRKYTSSAVNFIDKNLNFSLFANEYARH